MKGDKTVLKNLQTALTMELTAVHQYLLHAHVLDDWGLNGLAARMRAEMNEEMGHAGSFMARMVFLEGEPDAESMQSVSRAQTLKDLFQADLDDEYEARKFYSASAAQAIEAGDLGSAELFKQTALDEEGHVDWLEGQLTLLEKLGEAGFYQLYVKPEAGEEA
jgi:bacterioferritin